MLDLIKTERGTYINAKLVEVFYISKNLCVNEFQLMAAMPNYVLNQDVNYLIATYTKKDQAEQALEKLVNYIGNFIYDPQQEE